MSEEKLYAVKNDEGKYWDFSVKVNGFLSFSNVDVPVTIDKDLATEVARNSGGHVVTFVDEPKKVVLTKEQAEIVEKAKMNRFPASYVAQHTGYSGCLEKQLMNAYVNGYTVAKEKKYKVRVPETQTSYYYKGSDGHVHASDTSGGLDNEFSDYELQQYGLDGERFTKEEVTDDEQ